MKIICSKTDLINSVNIVMKAVPANTTISILNCILIDATGDVIKFIANDGDLGIETIVKGNIVENGMVAIDAKNLNEIFRSLPEVDITIDVDDSQNVKIFYGKSKFEINGEKGDSFTMIPYIEKNNSVVLSQLALKDVIRQTIFSIGINETNKVLRGIHFLINEDNLKVSALDGHRIAIRNLKLKESFGNIEAIIPGKALNEIVKILNGGADDNVNIYFTDNQALFEFEDTKVVTRLIEGKFFDVDKMTSYDYETNIVINRKDFNDCLSRSMLFSKEGNKKPIVVDINSERLRIYVNSNLGSMDEELNIEMQGRDLEIGFNPRFLSDAVKVIDDENIKIYFVNSKAPCYIRDDENTYTYLILPINFSKD